MLADPMISVRSFFVRSDPEKQFLYRLIMEEEDPEKAMENCRRVLLLINSQESYDRFLRAVFNIIFRDENRSIEQTLAPVEKAFRLNKRLQKKNMHEDSFPLRCMNNSDYYLEVR